mgnify:CR=1 FL=1
MPQYPVYKSYSIEGNTLRIHFENLGKGFLHPDPVRGFIIAGTDRIFYRRARGLTQSELAEAVKISRTHMSNIEAPNSHTSLSLNKLMDIAEALEIPLKTLFDFKR